MILHPICVETLILWGEMQLWSKVGPVKILRGKFKWGRKCWQFQGGESCQEGEGWRGRGKPPRANQNKIVKTMLEVKAEKAKLAQDKLARVKEKISVPPRKQPHREAAAAAAAAVAAAAADADEESEGELVHTDSEDIQSDISIESSDSYDYDKVLQSMVSYCTDSEFQDLLSGVDKEEFNERHKAKRKFLAQPRDKPIPILQRYQSTDRYSQKCEIIKRTAPEGTVPSVVGEGGRRVVVDLAEGFQIL